MKKYDNQWETLDMNQIVGSHHILFICLDALRYDVAKKQENLEKKRELWQYLKKKDLKTFLKIRYGILGQTMNIPGKPGRKISSLAYSVARRLIGFN